MSKHTTTETNEVVAGSVGCDGPSGRQAQWQLEGRVREVLDIFDRFSGFVNDLPNEHRTELTRQFKNEVERLAGEVETMERGDKIHVAFSHELFLLRLRLNAQMKSLESTSQDTVSNWRYHWDVTEAQADAVQSLLAARPGLPGTLNREPLPAIQGDASMLR